MNLHEFYSDPESQLPLARDAENFEEFIERVLSRYLARIEKLEHPSELAGEAQARLPAIAGFCNQLKDIVRAVLVGHPHDAYQHWVEAVPSIREFIDSQGIDSISGNRLSYLYRVRRTQSQALSREDLFHIPFELRHLVATQRYSIPGLPCLYLSGSLYTCWAEMGRPPFHEVHSAAFWIKEGEQVSLLNLSDRPARVLLYLNKFGDVGGRYDSELVASAHITTLARNTLFLWPLLALCSIVVKHRDAPFKPEYIVPQILLQWITRIDEYDGICYFSTHVDHVPGHRLAPVNFVFPTRSHKSRGRCEHLREIFRMTPPFAWELLRAINAGSQYAPAHRDFDFAFVEGLKESYYDTEFGNVQLKLVKLAEEIRRKETNGATPRSQVRE